MGALVKGRTAFRGDRGVGRGLTAALFVATVSFAFLSAAAASALGVAPWRALAFCSAFTALSAIALARRPRLGSRGRAAPFVLLALVAAMAALDIEGALRVYEYKIALPVLAIAIAPNLSAALDDGCGARWGAAEWFLAALALYIALTAALFLFAGETLARGAKNLQRFDVTGSMVAHSGLSAIFGFVALVAVRNARAPVARYAWLLGAAAALAMLLAAATRTTVLTLLLAAIFLASAAPKPRAALARTAAAGCVALGGFAFYTSWWNDSFWRRLSSFEGADYSSGRFTSIAHWLTEASDTGLRGLGLGHIREQLSDGRPRLADGELLEWPHNAFVRLFVEAGPIGFAFAALLVGATTRLALSAARREPKPLRRALLVAIAADMIAQSLLQNYLNSVYYATALILTLSTVAWARHAPERRSRPSARARRGQPGFEVA